MQLLDDYRNRTSRYFQSVLESPLIRKTVERYTSEFLQMDKQHNVNCVQESSAAKVELTVERLSILVGGDIHISSWFTVDQPCIDKFAMATGDFQWMHVDQDRARKELPHKTTIAHGFLILSLLPHLTEFNSTKKNILLLNGPKMVVNCGLRDVKFRSPVKCGSKIRTKTQLLSIRKRMNSVEAQLQIRVEVNDLSRPACVANTLVRLCF